MNCRKRLEPGRNATASYTVSRRNREFGARVALGAQHGDILRAALGRVCVLLVTGSVAGAVLSLAGSSVIASIVNQASAFDPLALAATALIMTLYDSHGASRCFLAGAPCPRFRTCSAVARMIDPENDPASEHVERSTSNVGGDRALAGFRYNSDPQEVVPGYLFAGASSHVSEVQTRKY